MSDQKLAELKKWLTEVTDLQNAGAVLEWDQETYMPPGGADARARQLGLLGRLAHERFTDAAVGRLLDALQAYGESLPYDHDDAALLRLTRRQYERAIRVPASFVEETSEHFSHSYNAWTEARPANDFAAVRPLLEKTLDYSRRYADYFPGYAHPADPLIDDGDFGMKATDIERVFAELRTGLVPLVSAITAQTPIDSSPLRRGYPNDAQLAFGVSVIKQYGYDFERGRQDLTHHPFMIKFANNDVRITTRSREDDLGDALFSTLHEAGHALYEQNIDPAFDGLPLDSGTSNGVHESQSRLWENLVGRSLGFWTRCYPALQAAFPAQLGDVSLDAFYRAINAVQNSLIRVDADEVTYNLHVMIRFDLELQLLDGRLSIADLPEAWNARYAADLGITPPDDRDGVLQDVHWYGGWIGGAFQGYTLGNILSAQFYNAALAAHPTIPDEIAEGKFATLLGWLRENIYRHGSKYTAPELIARVVGGLDVNPLLAYLRTKYSALYALQEAV
jgi:carboxypeptidase Taq